MRTSVKLDTRHTTDVFNDASEHTYPRAGHEIQKEEEEEEEESK